MTSEGEWYDVTPVEAARELKSQKPVRSCDTQGNFDGTMHPTAEGHGEWALQYAAAIRANSMT